MTQGDQLAANVDVNPLKPIPVVQPPRKVERRRQQREPSREHTAPEELDQDKNDDGSKRIDTYA